MTLVSSLLKTYDCVQNAAGITVTQASKGGEPTDKDRDTAVRSTLMPMNHTTLKVQIHVTLDSEGNVVSIEKESKAHTIIIPCTEKSMSRTVAPCAHPLCDQLQYVDKQIDGMRTEKYLTQLAEWKGDDAELNILYGYLSSHSISEDALGFGIELKPKTKDANGKESKGDAADGVWFTVVSPDGELVDLDRDPAIRARWQEYLAAGRSAKGHDMFGEKLYGQAKTFPKKLLPAAGNAKLISSNDSTNYVYRGRFTSPDQALVVDTDASQKIHTTLTWLLANNATIVGKQAILVWAVDGRPSFRVVNPMADTLDAFLAENDETGETSPDAVVADARMAVGTSYATQFRKLLHGYGDPSFLERQKRTIVVAVFDSAVPGRLGVTYYQELPEGEYLDRIVRWHRGVAWPLTAFVAMQGSDKRKPVDYVGAPSFIDIVNASTDSPDRSSDGYKLHRKLVERQLIETIFNGTAVPRNILMAMCHKVEKPMAYDDLRKWHRDLEICCSLLKKSANDEPKRFHRTGKEIGMELDKDRTDRDYLFGRLLALADNFEWYVLRKQNDGKADRATNAVNLMGNFASKPATTWEEIWRRLTPYIQSQNGASWFQQNVDDVMALFQPGDYEKKTPLGPLYLLGYSHQRRELMTNARKAKESAVTQEAAN